MYLIRRNYLFLCFSIPINCFGFWRALCSQI